MNDNDALNLFVSAITEGVKSSLSVIVCFCDLAASSLKRRIMLFSCVSFFCNTDVCQSRAAMRVLRHGGHICSVVVKLLRQDGLDYMSWGSA